MKMLVTGVASRLKGGVGVVTGRGSILAPKLVYRQSRRKGIHGQKLLICTGSSAAVPPFPAYAGAQSGFAMTNPRILDLRRIPEHLVVIGGGSIGLEMASYFNSVGSKVTVIEMLDHIAGATDSEISRF